MEIKTQCKKLQQKKKPKFVFECTISVYEYL